MSSSLQARYEEADSLYLRALDIIRAERGEEHVDFAATLNNRAGLLKAQVNPERYNIYSP